MPPIDGATLAREAYEVSIQTRATLQAHLDSCDRRAQQLIDLVTTKHDALNRQIGTIQTVFLTIGGTVITGLLSVVGILLHNGGHF